MDPRHVTHELSLLNQIIDLINTYRKENMDHLMEDEHLQAEMRNICSLIYAAAKQWVDTSALISKKNLLSIDPVSLPPIKDNVILDKEEIKKLYYEIKVIAEQHDETDVFYPSLLSILNNYSFEH